MLSKSEVTFFLSVATLFLGTNLFGHLEKKSLCPYLALGSKGKFMTDLE